MSSSPMCFFLQKSPLGSPFAPKSGLPPSSFSDDFSRQFFSFVVTHRRFCCLTSLFLTAPVGLCLAPLFPFKCAKTTDYVLLFCPQIFSLLYSVYFRPSADPADFSLFFPPSFGYLPTLCFVTPLPLPLTRHPPLFHPFSAPFFLFSSLERHTNHGGKRFLL